MSPLISTPVTFKIHGKTITENTFPKLRKKSMKPEKLKWVGCIVEIETKVNYLKKSIIK